MGNVIEEKVHHVAHHYGASLELARAAGVSTAQFEKPARLAFKRAGDRATRLGAFVSAIPLYSSALELWPVDEVERAYVLLGLGRAISFIEQEGADLLAEARAAFEAAGDVEGAAQAARALSQLAWLRGETTRANELIAQAAALLDAAPPSRAKAEVLLGVSGRHMLNDDFVAAIEIGEQALAIAEAVGNDDVRVGAMLNIGASRIRTTGWESGATVMEDAVAIGREVRSWQRIRGMGMLRDCTFEHGDLERATELGTEGLAEATRAGHTAPIRWLTGELAYDHYHAGGWDRAFEMLESTFDEAGRTWWFEPAALQLRGAIRLARGEPGPVQDAARALELAREALDPQMMYPALAFSAVLELAAGNTSAAAEHADELLAGWSARKGQEPRASWVVDLSVVLLRLGREREFTAALAPVAGYSRWVEAALAVAEHRPIDAAEVFARMGSRPYSALARMEAGRALDAEGRPLEAASQLDEAASFWRSVRARAYLNEAEALRAAAS